MVFPCELFFHSRNLCGNVIGHHEECADCPAAEQTADTADNDLYELRSADQTHKEVGTEEEGHNRNGKGNQASLISETNTFLRLQFIEQIQHYGYGCERAGIQYCHFAAAHAHTADDECVHTDKEHLQAEIGAAVYRFPTHEDLVFEGELHAFADANLFFLQTVVFGIAVLFALFNQEQGDKQGQHQGQAHEYELVDTDLRAAQNKGNERIYKTVRNGIEERFVARYAKSLRLVGTSRRQRTVIGNHCKGVRRKEDERPNDDPNRIDELHSKLRAGDPASNGQPTHSERQRHRDKTSQNRGPSTSPFRRHRIRYVRKGNIDDTVECLCNRKQNREDRRQDKASTACNRLERAFAKCRRVNRVRKIRTHKHHQKVRAEARKTEEEFFSLLVKRFDFHL